MSKHCCDTMGRYADNTCDQHEDRFDCPDCLIHVRKDGSYGIIVHDGGSSVILMAHCPWCGRELPEPEDAGQRMIEVD